MKKHLFSNVAVTMLMAFIASFTLSSCSEEIIVEDKQENQEENLDIPENATVFTTGGDETTRTSIDLDAYFYWTENDKIWVDVAKDGSFSTGSDDMLMSSDKRLAKFIFAGKTMNEPTYELTYTGINSTSGTKVTIPQDQSQNQPNDATHIGRNGDCATAVAEKKGGKYEFKLQHKAHYLIFQPYTDIPDDKTWKLKSIEIIDLDDKPLCGTYDFGMDGLTNVQSPNSTITISTIGSDPNGVELLEKTASDKPTWYAVIAPATDGKRNLRIKYTIYPAAEVNYINGASQNTDIVIVKDLPRDHPSVANKVTKIAHKMTLMNVPTNLFHMWDATTPYCQGITSDPPHYYGAVITGYATESTDPRYTSLAAYLTTRYDAQNSPCNGLPNVNAATWYALAGDPRWEEEYPWCFDNDYNYIYTKGAWLKKWSVIVAENSTVLAGKSFTDCDVSFIGTIPIYNNAQEIVEEGRTYDGTDYRDIMFPSETWFQSRNPAYRFNGRPNDITDYFFLPASGCINDGTKRQLMTGGGIHGCYWLSSSTPNTNPDEYKVSGARAHIMETKNFNIMVRDRNASTTNGRPAPTGWWK